MKFVHLSDLHIHGDDREDQAIADTLNLIQTRCPEHYVLVTGDITDDGDEGQYEKAAELLSPFSGRLFLTCGNHDYGKLGNFYDEERESRYAALEQKMKQPKRVKQLYSVDFGDEVKLIVLDSNLRTESPLDFACGQIEDEQLGQLDKELASSHKVKIIALHHHPFIHFDPTMKLLDADEFLAVCSGRTDAMLFGHRHKQDVWANRSGIGWLTASGRTADEGAAFEIIAENGRITVGSMPLR